MKKLSFIVPHFSEDERTVRPLLDSFATQSAVNLTDYEFIIVHDGPKARELDEKFLANYPFARVLRTPENVGPGMARQFGIDNSEADWILLGDCDDILDNALVLHFFETQVIPSGLDAVYTQWKGIHRKDDGSYLIQQQGAEMAWCFGVFARRSYITKVGARFHPELRVHEEQVYRALIAMNSDKIKRIEYPTYLWRPAEGSITRRDGQSYGFNSMDVFCRANDIVCEELDKRNKEKDCLTRAVQHTIHAYQILTCEWVGDHRALKEGPCDGLTYRDHLYLWEAYFYHKWSEKYFDRLTPDEWKILFQNWQGGKPMVAWDDFVKKLKELPPERPAMFGPRIDVEKKGLV
jgi:glycosyltransferase involved in cell wall biosynthesis